MIMSIVETLKRQLETLKIENLTGTMAIDLSPVSATYQCLLFMHEGLKDWVKQREASPTEVLAAKKRLEGLKLEYTAILNETNPITITTINKSMLSNEDSTPIKPEDNLKSDATVSEGSPESSPEADSAAAT